MVKAPTCLFSNKIEDTQSMDGVDSTHPTILPWPHYAFWLDAIIFDNVEEVETHLQSAENKNQLLNGTLEKSPSFGILNSKIVMTGSYTGFTVCKPWCLAGVFQSHNVIASFIKHGVDVLQVDREGNNILHCLIYMAFLEDAEENYLETMNTLLELMQGRQQINKQLFMTENAEGMRPLELAAHLGCFLIMMKIFEYPGIYLVKEEPHDMYNLQWYDVTDYELCHKTYRAMQSPIVALTYMDSKLLDKENTSRLYQSDIVQAWFCAKRLANMPFIIIWFLMRVTFIVALYTLDYCIFNSDFFTAELIQNNQEILFSANTTNTSTSNCEVRTKYKIPSALITFLLAYIGVHSLWIVVFDFAEYIYNKKNKISKLLKTPLGEKNMVVYYTVYRVMQFILGLGVTTMTCSLYYVIHGKSAFLPINSDVTYIMIQFSIVWSILYFLQWLPWLGHFIVAVQRMLKDLAQFAVLLLIFITPYAVTFHKYLYDADNNVCVQTFNTLGISFYSTFTMMLNMINFTTYNTTNHGILLFMHVLLVFMIPILLINLLIAIFSNSYAEIARHKNIVMSIQNLSMVTIIEKRITFLCPGICRWMKKKTFVYENGRLYITRLVRRKKAHMWRINIEDY